MRTSSWTKARLAVISGAPSKYPYFVFVLFDAIPIERAFARMYSAKSMDRRSIVRSARREASHRTLNRSAATAEPVSCLATVMTGMAPSPVCRATASHRVPIRWPGITTRGKAARRASPKSHVRLSYSCRWPENASYSVYFIFLELTFTRSSSKRSTMLLSTSPCWARMSRFSKRKSES